MRCVVVRLYRKAAAKLCLLPAPTACPIPVLLPQIGPISSHLKGGPVLHPWPCWSCHGPSTKHWAGLGSPCPCCALSPPQPQALPPSLPHALPSSGSIHISHFPSVRRRQTGSQKPFPALPQLGSFLPSFPTRRTRPHELGQSRTAGSHGHSSVLPLLSRAAGRWGAADSWVAARHARAAPTHLCGALLQEKAPGTFVAGQSDKPHSCFNVCCHFHSLPACSVSALPPLDLPYPRRTGSSGIKVNFFYLINLQKASSTARCTFPNHVMLFFRPEAGSAPEESQPMVPPPPPRTVSSASSGGPAAPQCWCRRCGEALPPPASLRGALMFGKRKLL